MVPLRNYTGWLILPVGYCWPTYLTVFITQVLWWWALMIMSSSSQNVRWCPVLSWFEWDVVCPVCGRHLHVSCVGVHTVAHMCCGSLCWPWWATYQLVHFSHHHCMIHMHELWTDMISLMTDVNAGIDFYWWFWFHCLGATLTDWVSPTVLVSCIRIRL